MKNVKKLLTVLTFLFIFAFPTVISASTKEYTIDKLNVQAEILSNGDVNVIEAIGYNFSGDFKGIYRHLKLDGTPEYEISEVYALDKNGNKQILTEGYNQTNYTYEVNNNGDYKEIKIFCPSSNEEKTFFFKYTIKEAAKKYTDLGELYWNFYTVEDVPSIKEGSLALSLKDSSFNASDFNYKVFGDGDFETNYDDNSVSINFKNLTSLIGIQLDFQKDFLSSASEINMTTKEAAEKLPSLSDDDTKPVLFIVLFIILGIGIIFLGLFINNKKFKRELSKYRSKFTFLPNEIYVEAPKVISPALVNLLINEKLVSKNMLTPTLFYLVKKGYYTISETTYYPKKNSKKSKEDLIFTRVLSKGFPKENHLIFLIDWFSKYEVNNSFSLQGIKNKLKFEEESLNFINKLNEWIVEVEEDAESYHFFTTICGKKVLRNKYYNEQLKWLSYKNYLLNLNIENSTANKDLTKIDEPLIYAEALDIDYKSIKSLIDIISDESKVHSDSISESSYLYCNNYFLYTLLVNDINGNAHSNLNNSTDSSFSGFSSGSNFTGGGGGGSGAF
nr:DUF2207 domain-containing protein [Clostridium chauvoei]